MRIGIDARYLSHGLVGGVHAYIKSFLPELLRMASAHEVVLYADTKRPFELSDMPSHVTLRLLPYRNPVSSFVLDVRLQQYMEADRIDVAHFPANYGFGPRNGRTVITLHDEINILPLRNIIAGHRKDPRTLSMMTYLHFCSTAAIRRASRVITVSEYAKRQILNYSSLPSDRVISIYHGRATDLRRIEDPAQQQALRQRFNLPQRFILADGLKNPGVVIRAWKLLPQELRSHVRIVMFSRRPDPLPVVTEAVAEGVVQLLVRPSREDLIGLFSLTEAFVFPSWIEGFGIPLLEAMTCGAPVIASDRGSIPEVLGGVGLIADAEDAETFAQHMQRVLSHQNQALQMRQAGYQRAAEFSWERTASAILSTYEQHNHRQAQAQR
jgi:glycosyltransferase involved in cell wall biosynthesis